MNIMVMRAWECSERLIHSSRRIPGPRGFCAGLPITFALVVCDSLETVGLVVENLYLMMMAQHCAAVA